MLAFIFGPDTWRTIGEVAIVVVAATWIVGFITAIIFLMGGFDR